MKTRWILHVVSAIEGKTLDDLGMFSKKVVLDKIPEVGDRVSVMGKLYVVRWLIEQEDGSIDIDIGGYPADLTRREIRDWMTSIGWKFINGPGVGAILEVAGDDPSGKFKRGNKVRLKERKT